MGGKISVWVWLDLLISIPFWSLFILPLAVTLFPIRWGVQIALNFIYGKGRYTLAEGIDAVFANDSTPGCSSSPNLILIQKGDPDVHKIRERLLKNAFEFKEGGKFIYRERLQKRFVSNKWGWACWEDVSQSFDISRHVRMVNGLGTNIVTKEKVLEILGKLQDTPFQDKLPQWEILLVPNYSPNNTINSGNVHHATIYRQHHAYGDGASTFIMVDNTLADEPLVWTKIDPLKQLPISNFIHWMIFLKSYILGPLPFLRTLLTAIKDDSPFIMKKGYSNRKFMACSKPFNLKFLKELSTASGATLSSLVLTVFCGAMKKLYVNRHNTDPKFKYPLSNVLNVGVVSAMIPYKSRQMQNTFSTFSVPCAFNEQDVLKRLKETQSAIKNVAGSSEPIFNFFMMRFIGYLPRFIQDLFISCAGTPALFSNVPGPANTMSICGNQVVEMGAWLPLIKTYGMGITTVGYNGRFLICLATDSYLVPSKSQLQSLISHMEEELHVLGLVHKVCCPIYCDEKMKYKHYSAEG